jgi:membrane protein
MAHSLSRPGSRRRDPPRLATLLLAALAALVLPRARPARSQPFSKESAAFGGTRSSDEPRARHQARARQSGRGREAVKPTQIPWRGWKDIFWRVYDEIGKDRLLAVAAGVVFFGLLATFPAITAFVSSYGLFASYSTIDQHLALLAGFLPDGAMQIVQDQVNRIVAKGDVTLSFAFLFSLALALWSANAGMKAIIDALNVIYEEEEKRSFIRLNLVSLALTAGAIAALLLALGAVVVLPLLFGWLGLSSFTETIIAVLRWPALLLLVMTGLAVLYRYGPSRTKPRWEWLSVGSIFATFAWLAGSALLSWYLANFADYDATYGSLGAAIGFMMWMWLSSIVILVGAEINAEMEHQTARDTTLAKKPLGRRGAVMADTVGEARS